MPGPVQLWQKKSYLKWLITTRYSNYLTKRASDINREIVVRLSGPVNVPAMPQYLKIIRKLGAAVNTAQIGLQETTISVQ